MVCSAMRSEIAYFQFFCGDTYDRWCAGQPLETHVDVGAGSGASAPTSSKCCSLETLELRRHGQRPSIDRRCQRVIIDHEAHSKAVAHPTDIHRLLRAIEWLIELA